MKRNKSIKAPRMSTGKRSLPKTNGCSCTNGNGKSAARGISPGPASEDGQPSEAAQALENYWRTDPRWQGVTRSFTPQQVLRLRGTLKIEHTIADKMSRKLWDLLHTEPYVNALGALTGNQAVQMAQAGLKAIYLSGWQVAADANLAAATYPDQSLYPANSVPMVIRRLNKALQRADQIQTLRSGPQPNLWTPIVADAEAGFGGPLNAFELMGQMIEEGVAAVHFEDQLASAKKCGHMGGKVLVPAFEFIHKLTAARLAADVRACPLSWSHAQMPKPLNCSPVTSTSAISRSARANARMRVISGSAPAST